MHTHSDSFPDIRFLISKRRLDRAIECIESIKDGFEEDHRLFLEAILARYHQNKNEKLLGLKKDEIESNQIVFSILEFIQGLETSQRKVVNIFPLDFNIEEGIEVEFISDYWNRRDAFKIPADISIANLKSALVKNYRLREQLFPKYPTGQVNWSIYLNHPKYEGEENISAAEVGIKNKDKIKIEGELIIRQTRIGMNPLKRDPDPQDD